MTTLTLTTISAPVSLHTTRRPSYSSGAEAAPLAQSVKGCQESGSSHERGNERARCSESRNGGGSCKIVEERTRADSTADTQSQIQRHAPASTLEAPDGDEAGDEPEKDEDNG